MVWALILLLKLVDVFLSKVFARGHFEKSCHVGKGVSVGHEKRSISLFKSVDKICLHINEVFVNSDEISSEKVIVKFLVGHELLHSHLQQEKQVEYC